MYKDSKQLLLNNLHKLIRRDKYIQDILNASGIELDQLKEKMSQLEKEFLFESMSQERIDALEKELNFKAKSEKIEIKRLELEARWKTRGKCTLELLQETANVWRNGEVEVKFIDGAINIEFTSVVGVPYGIEHLKKALTEAIPAHLGINFKIRNRVWCNLPPKTWKYYSNYTWKELVEREDI